MTARRVLAAVLAAFIATARAQLFGGYDGGWGPFNGDSGSGSGSSSNSGSGITGSGSTSGFGNFQNGIGFDMDEAMRARAVHGILGAVAMVALFPGGAILMRVLPAGRLALWAHALAQLAATGVLVAAVALGIGLVQEVRLPLGGGSLMSNPDTNYHPIIGLVVLGCLLVQPILGVVHHARFKKVRRRQIWSHLHLFNGRIGITLGIVNGALGLWMADASAGLKMTYVAVAVVMWSLWMLVAGWAEWRRWRAAEKQGQGNQKLSHA